MPQDTDHIATMTRMIAECLNCLGIVASPEAFKQLDTPQKREEFWHVLEKLMDAYFEFTRQLDDGAGALNVREMAFVRAEPLLRAFQETLRASGFSDEQTLRRQVIAFLNAFGAAMNVEGLGDLISSAPLPDAPKK